MAITILTEISVIFATYDRHMSHSGHWRVKCQGNDRYMRRIGPIAFFIGQASGVRQRMRRAAGNRLFGKMLAGAAALLPIWQDHGKIKDETSSLKLARSEPNNSWA